jgi:hypothetical protein
VFDKSVLCSWECLQKETEKRGRGKTVREFQFQTVTVCFSFEETERGLRVEEASDMQV